MAGRTDEIPIEISDFAKTCEGVLEQVEAGRSFVLMRNGEPVARLRSVLDPTVETRRQAAERMLARRRGRYLGMPLRQAIRTGRP